MTKTQTGSGNLAAGINHYLKDQTHGRRSVAWLADQIGISRSTMRYYLTERPERLNADVLERSAAALGVTFLDLYEAGKEAA